MKNIETLEDAQYFIDRFREIGAESTTLYGVQSWTYDRHLPGEDGSLIVDNLPVTITIDKQDKLTKYCYTDDVGRCVKELIPLTTQDIFEDRKYINYALSVQGMLK
jgi:PII-like signaling protein